jgi:hypothetical protein
LSQKPAVTPQVVQVETGRLADVDSRCLAEPRPETVHDEVRFELERIIEIKADLDRQKEPR